MRSTGEGGHVADEGVRGSWAGLGPAGSLTVCLAVKMGPGSYSVSVLECADEGERKGRWWVGKVGGVTDQTACPSAGLRRLSPLTENRDSNYSLQVLCLTFLFFLRSCDCAFDGQNMTCFSKELVYPLWFSLNVLLFLLTRRKSFLQSYHDTSV